jgi:ribosome maturation factor RimP
MSWQHTVEQTIVGLGFDLVDIEKSAGGLLRITIDLPWQPSQAAVQFVTVEDCERVTRQLQLLLEVENVDYKRLEVGSPGIDRPLRHRSDFERFVGEVIDIVLKEPIGAAAAGAVAANRKKFRGQLQNADSTGAWCITWVDEPLRKPGQKVGKHAKPAPLQSMTFQLDEIREARLAPIVNFKGRGAAAPEKAEKK